MMEEEKPVLDMIMTGINQMVFGMTQIFWYLKILELYLQQALFQNRNNNLFVNMYFKSNLNDGNGDPCAGQVRANDFATRSSKATRFIFDENFGRLLPTGSEMGKMIHD